MTVPTIIQDLSTQLVHTCIVYMLATGSIIGMHIFKQVPGKGHVVQPRSLWWMLDRSVKPIDGSRVVAGLGFIEVEKLAHEGKCHF